MSNRYTIIQQDYSHIYIQIQCNLSNLSLNQMPSIQYRFYLQSINKHSIKYSYSHLNSLNNQHIKNFLHSLNMLKIVVVHIIGVNQGWKSMNHLLSIQYILLEAIYIRFMQYKGIVSQQMYKGRLCRWKVIKLLVFRQFISKKQNMKDLMDHQVFMQHMFYLYQYLFLNSKQILFFHMYQCLNLCNLHIHHSIQN